MKSVTGDACSVKAGAARAVGVWFPLWMTINGGSTDHWKRGRTGGAQFLQVDSLNWRAWGCIQFSTDCLWTGRHKTR